MTQTYDINDIPIMVFCDGPNGKATRLSFYTSEQAFKKQQDPVMNIDFEDSTDVLAWFVLQGRMVAGAMRQLTGRDKNNGH